MIGERLFKTETVGVRSRRGRLANGLLVAFYFFLGFSVMASSPGTPALVYCVLGGLFFIVGLILGMKIDAGGICLFSTIIQGIFTMILFRIVPTASDIMDLNGESVWREAIRRGFPGEITALVAAQMIPLICVFLYLAGLFLLFRHIDLRNFPGKNLKWIYSAIAIFLITLTYILRRIVPGDYYNADEVHYLEFYPVALASSAGLQAVALWAMGPWLSKKKAARPILKQQTPA